MGFYFELKPVSGTKEFRESSAPSAYWVLLGIGAFAMACMAASASHLLVKLWGDGDVWDKVLVSALILGPVVLLACAMKLLWIRKFVRTENTHLVYGYSLGKFFEWTRRIPKSEILEMKLTNPKPRPNQAPLQHDNSEYYVKGHWRVVAKLRSKKEICLDRHTEKGALTALYEAVQNWKHCVPAEV